MITFKNHHINNPKQVKRKAEQEKKEKNVSSRRKVCEGRGPSAKSSRRGRKQNERPCEEDEQQEKKT